MKILVTGGAGFIGTYFARELLQAGHAVTILDDFSEVLYAASLKKARLAQLLSGQNVAVVEGSILDADLLEKTFTEGVFDAVIHLAALANPGRSLELPDLYHEVNVNGTETLLAAASEHNIGRIIFAGSSSVYNDSQTPFREESYPLSPKSPYGESKVAAEQLIKNWQKTQGGTATIFRFFSVYGPWGRPDMAPLIFTDHIVRGEPITVTKDERERDFTYIDDVVSVLLPALELPAGFEVINIGRGEPTKLPVLITAIEKAAGKKADIVYRDAPPGEMRVTYADTTKAARLLNYHPKVSVEAGIAQLVAWYQEWHEKLPLKPSF